VRVRVIAFDLMDASAPGQIIAELARDEIEVDFLVNNAGFGDTGAFTELDSDRQLGMLKVNVVALTELTRALGPQMRARGRGRVLNIGSTAGFQPGPFMAVYYASKAYVNSFTEALAYELDGSGVTATLSCPGPTLTEFAAVAGNDKTPLFAAGAMTGARVAYQAYHAMMNGERRVVHGLANAIGVAGGRLVPSGLMLAIAARLNQNKRS
jgi:hypothetical protein